MIRQFGTMGFFIKFNESASAGIRLVNIFSSSAATTTLFSASTNSSRNIIFSSTASCYINGQVSSSIVDNQWQHVSFTFNPKLQTDSSNNFLVRFGQSGSADFQIQNIYLLDTLLDNTEIRYLHNTFTGASAILSTGESSSASLLILDKDERRHSSSATSVVYQPYKDQLKFLIDVDLVAEVSLAAYLGSPTTKLTGDLRYFDGILSIESDLVLSTVDNAIYELNSSGGVTLVNSSNGDYVSILNGIEHIDSRWLKTSGSFTKVPFVEKITYTVDRSTQE